MRLRTRAARALACAALLGAAAAAVSAFTYFPSSSGNPCIWPPHYAAVYLSPNTLTPSSFYGASFRAAVSTWGTNPDSDFRWFAFDGFHDPQFGDLDGANDAYVAPLGYSVLGVTYVYTNDNASALYDCDVAMSSYAGFWAPGYYDFQTTALHELGHALGLGHTPIFGSVMYPFGYAGEQNRTLQADDLAGEAFLYPASAGGGGGGVPPPPPSFPVRRGTMTGLTPSSLDVLVGDPLTFTATVRNDEDGPLLLSGAQTVPATSGTWTEVLMQPDESREYVLARTVLEIPGLYPARLHLGGLDPTTAHFAQQETPWYPVRVRRPPIHLDLQDELTASLGPQGEDRVSLFLGRRQKVVLDFLSGTGWEGERTVRLEDPSGEALETWKAGRTFRARAAGVHSLVAVNEGGKKGNYRLQTLAVSAPRRIKGKGSLDGTWAVEIPFSAWARTTVLLKAKGPKALAPRITGLRSPSGATVDLVDGAEVLVESFGEDGVWTAIVEGNPGVAGKARITGRPAWTEGMQQTR